MKKICLYLLIVLTVTACEKTLIPNIENTPTKVFEELWKYVDEHYIYFDTKQVDWDEVYSEYAPMINDQLTDIQLFEICAAMVAELKDGHNVLRRSTRSSNAYDFTIGYEVLFDPTIVRENYLNNEFEEAGEYTYGIIGGNIGYTHFKDFKPTGDIKTVINFLEEQQVDGLIFDVRSNGGGGFAERIVKHFIDKTTTVGYTVEKAGKGHNEVTDNLSFVIQPATPYFSKPVKVLTNRGSFSATSYFAGKMKHLPNVTIIGQITGGGGGGNAAYQLPNGWNISVSVSTFLDTEFEDIEGGVVPHIELNNDTDRLANGIDDILERALADF